MIDSSDRATAHERAYLSLRQQILMGAFAPGEVLTLRGIAQGLNVSLTPAREAVRRLLAERALVAGANRRLSIPALKAQEYDDLMGLRLYLEPMLSERASDQMGSQVASELAAIDKRLDDRIMAGDIAGYVRENHAFHFTIYRAARAPHLLALVESAWLQTGPFMRVIYGRIGTGRLVDHHKAAIEAARKQDGAALAAAIRADIEQSASIVHQAGYFSA